MTKKYAIFEINNGDSKLQLASGFANYPFNYNCYLPELRFDTEQEALEVLQDAYALPENTEFVILAVYNV